MMPDSPDGWAHTLLGYWCSQGLSVEQAQDCLSETFLRYSRRRDLPPWNAGEPPPSLWRIARDVLCEHWRRRAREQQQTERLLVHYRCIWYRPCDDEVEAETFRLSLPPRLSEVLALRLEGYTCREIAGLLHLSESTVKSYLAELRTKFREFYGYDPTKSPSDSGYIYGSLTAGEDDTSDKKEDTTDANAHSSGMDGDGASGGKRVRPASHPRRARRRAGGGGWIPQA